MKNDKVGLFWGTQCLNAAGDVVLPNFKKMSKLAEIESQ